MKSWILFIIYGIVMLAFKSVWGGPWDFLLLAVIYLGFYEEWRLGLGITLLFGFLFDVSSISPMGTAVFSYTLIFGLIRFFRKKILFQTILSRFCWVFVFTGVEQCVSHLFIRFWGHTLYPILFHMLSNAALGLLWIPFIGWYRNLSWQVLMHEKDILLKK